MTDDTTDAGDAGMTPEQAMLMAATTSNLVARHEFANQAGLQFGGDRDLWEALGYPQRLAYQDYRDWYDRGGIAKTIIDKPPETTWSERPDIVDDAEVGEDESTDFEDDVEELFDASSNTNLDRGLRHYLERTDKLGRIGEYSVLFLGLADADSASALADPVDTSGLSGLDDLLYVTPLGEGDATINDWVSDITDARNGLPETYKLDLANGDQTQTVVVHHTRVVHVAEGILDDEVCGEPALRAVMNRLVDLEKVAGSSAEAYWMVSNPGLALSVDPQFADVPTEKMDEQIDEYEHNLRRVLKLYGTDAEQLESQDVNPEGVIDSLIKLIAGTIELPQRKLVGSERGELASSQDEANYLELISSRQTSYSEPVQLRPLLDRLIEFGIVAAPRAGTYTVEWPNLFQLTDLEQAQLLKTEMEAISQAAPMGEATELYPPDILRERLPLEVPEDETPPDEQPDIDEEIDEDDEDVQEQFDELMDHTPPVEADD